MPGSTDANFSDNFSDLSYEMPKRKCPIWLYDPRTKTLFGRTASSWCSVIFFYLIFFSCLAGFFMGMMLTFLYRIVPTHHPLRSGEHSLLKLSPGLGIRPSQVGDTLIHYSTRDPQSYRVYVQNIDAFLNFYYDLNAKSSDNFATCKDGKKTPEDVNKVCKFSLSDLGPCNKDNNYGYGTKKPCVLVKLNKIYGWLPSIKTNSTVRHPLIKCKGQNPLDNSHIGKMSYYPKAVSDGVEYGMFDSSFYPYVGQTSYVSPLVAVQFESLRPHTTVLIECELFNVNTFTPTDSAKFEIMVD